MIGLGRIGWELEHDPLRSKPSSHVGAYLASPRTELVAVADIDSQKLEAFRQEYPSIPCYTDYEKMLSDTRPQIVSIATPTGSHCRITRNTCRYHPVSVIFCEKPISSTVEDAERMIRTCEQFGVKLAVNHTRRYDPAYREVKTILERGTIGDLLAFSGRFSGGRIREGVHMADLAQWFQQEKTIIDLINVPTPYLVFEADLVGSNGWIRIRDNGARIELLKPDESKRYAGLRELYHVANLGKRYDFSRAMLNAVDDLVECATGDKHPECAGKDGLEALKLALERVV